jgi:hypothetical protein
MGLYETQNRLGQSETLMLLFSKNKFKFVSTKNKVRVLFCPVFHTAPFPPYSDLDSFEIHLHHLANHSLKA